MIHQSVLIAISCDLFRTFASKQARADALRYPCLQACQLASLCDDNLLFRQQVDTRRAMRRGIFASGFALGRERRRPRLDAVEPELNTAS
jgi:hypothetical protein